MKERLANEIPNIKMGDVSDFHNFMGAVIDEKSFTKIGGYLEEARNTGTIIIGGTATRDVGYFVAPPYFPVSVGR